MAKKEPGQNTYNRIIENSLILFNEQGERNCITIVKIKTKSSFNYSNDTAMH